MIRLGIAGFGNLGKGLVASLNNFSDLDLVGVFTRRDPSTLAQSGLCLRGRTVDFFSYREILKFKDQLDVIILAGGSREDIPKQGPDLIRNFNTVDCFDNHAEIPEYFAQMDKLAKDHKRVALISTGWDPGLFSIQRFLSAAVLPDASTYTFWGPGLSQGHSDVVRRVKGVKYGVQYTLPRESLLTQIRSGQEVDYSSAKAHTRQVFVVLEESADPDAVVQEIKSIPDYFAPYETEVNFISEAEFLAEHQKMPHGGYVIRQGFSSRAGGQGNFDKRDSAGGANKLVASSQTEDHKARIEFQLALDSNPEFTAGASLAFARAAHRLYQQSEFGAKTVLDVPLSMLADKPSTELLNFI